MCLFFLFVCFGQETANASPVILRVDPKGFYLYWTYQNKVSAEISQVGLQIVNSSMCKIRTPEVLEYCTQESSHAHST